MAVEAWRVQGLFLITDHSSSRMEEKNTILSDERFSHSRQLTLMVDTCWATLEFWIEQRRECERGRKSSVSKVFFRLRWDQDECGILIYHKGRFNFLGWQSWSTSKCILIAIFIWKRRKKFIIFLVHDTSKEHPDDDKVSITDLTLISSQLNAISISLFTNLLIL